MAHQSLLLRSNMALPYFSNQQVIDQLNSGFKWPDSTISYSFPEYSSSIFSQDPEVEGTFSPVAYSLRPLFELGVNLWGDLIPQSLNTPPAPTIPLAPRSLAPTIG